MERIKNFVILGLAIALGIVLYMNSGDDPIPDPVDVIIPGSQGSTGVVNLVPEDSVKTVTVYLPGTVKKEVVVDSLYKKRYEDAVAAKDSVAAKLVLLEAIRIREYNKIAIDNDTIRVDLYAKTRGELLAYKIDYNVKDQTFTYTPEVINVRPKVTMLTGLELGMSQLGQDPSLKLDVYFQNRKGHMYGAGLDTQGNYFVGYKHAINLKGLNPFKKNK